jgi:hypothetical protein
MAKDELGETLQQHAGKAWVFLAICAWVLSKNGFHGTGT